MVDVVKCIKRCTGFLKVDPSFVQPCLDSCNLSLGKNIKETLARMPVFKDPAVAAVKNDDTLYRDGLLLQSDITTLNKAISYDQKAQPGNLFASLFSNLGFLQPSNSFASPAQPTLGMFLKCIFYWWDISVPRNLLLDESNQHIVLTHPTYFVPIFSLLRTCQIKK